MIYTVTCNPALDYVMTIHNMSSGNIYRSTKEELTFGGKGINVSVMLSRLGIKTTALGFVAGFTGNELKKILSKENVNCEFVELENGMTRINVKLSGQKEIEINGNGPMVNDADINKLIAKLQQINSGDYLVLSGSVSSNLPDNLYEQILYNLADKNIRFIVDAEAPLLLNTLKYRPFLIKPNHYELGTIFNTEINTTSKIEFFARKLQEMGAENVLVSRAEKGAKLLDKYGNLHNIKNAPGKLINSVGCGDSMLAGFLAGFCETQDYEYALKLGAACGNASAYCEGLATKERIENILDYLLNR